MSDAIENNDIDIEATPVYEKLDERIQSGDRIIVLEGGSRSSKTWSIIQRLLVYAQENPGKTFTISRARMTWLRMTLMKDFVEIVNKLDLDVTPEFNLNRQVQEYRIFDCEFAFIGLDEPQKLHGRKQDVFWINEAIESTQKDFDQLEMRTNDFGILDYNPSVEDHWIFDSVIPRPDVTMFRSTMLDNPFLNNAIRRKILSYNPDDPQNVINGTADETNWKIYGLGVRARQKDLILTNWSVVKKFPEDYKWIVSGMDFGFTNDPTGVIRVCLHEGRLFVDELIYETGLTNPDISNKLKEIDHPKTQEIIADSSEPKSIKEISRMGWRVVGAVKGPDSVRAGIQVLQSYQIHVTEKSVHLIKELKNYKWKKDPHNDKKLLNEPVDNFNHLIDALRYAVGSKVIAKKGTGKYRIS